MKTRLQESLKSLRHSIRARMTLWLAATVALVMGCSVVFSQLNTRRTMENHFAASLSTASSEVREAIAKGATTKTLDRVLAAHNAQVTENGAISESVKAWLLDARNQVQWESSLPPPPDHFEPPPFDAEGHRHLIPPLADPGGWRTAQISWQGQRLLLALPWHRAQDDLRDQGVLLAMLTALATGVTAIGAWFLVGRTLAPIDSLALQAEHAAARPNEATPTRLNATSPDAEIVHLVQTFNAMLDSLQEAGLSKERFHASASHELRTPLAGLAGLLSLTLTRDRSNEEYREALQEATRMTARLTRLTHDLLLLNRLQTAASAPPKELVDIAEVLDLALQRAQNQIEAHSLQLEESLDTLEVEAPPSHVEILLGNLLENAAKYAHPNGLLRVTINPAATQVSIENECDAELLASLAAQKERLFESFFRPDASRQSQTGGNGLGLAICQAICEANAWELKLETAERESLVRVKIIFS